MAAAPEDRTDQHVAQWDELWTDRDGRDRLTEAALHRANRLEQYSLRALRELLRSDELSFDGFLTLHALVGGRVTGTPRSAPAQLAKSAGVSRAAMTTRLDRLEHAGFITRSSDPDDGRGVIVSITADGRAAWDRVIGRWSRAEQELLGGLSIAELTQLNALLRRACSQIERRDREAAEGDSGPSTSD